MKALLKFRYDYLEVEQYFPTEDEYNNPDYRFFKDKRYWVTENGEIYDEEDFDFNYIPRPKYYERLGTVTRNSRGTLCFKQENDNTLYQIPKDLYPELEENESINVILTITKL